MFIKHCLWKKIRLQTVNITTPTVWKTITSGGQITVYFILFLDWFLSIYLVML